MDNMNNEKNMRSSSFADLSVDSILAEFRAEEEVASIISEDSSSQSRSIIMENEGQAIGEAKISSTADFINPVAEVGSFFDDPNSHNADADFKEYTPSKQTPVFEDPFAEPVFKPPEERRSNSYAADVDDTVVFEKKPRGEDEPIWTETVDSEQEGGEYAPSGEYERSAYAQDDRSDEGSDFKERRISPIIGLIAASSMKREEKRRAERARAEEEAKRQLPDMSPEKAARLYIDQAMSMRLRCLFATALSLVLVWLSYGLPAMGILGSSLLVRTLVCLIFQLVIMLVGLDIFTNGVVSLFKKSPGLESLIAVSCIVSIADAIYIIISNIDIPVKNTSTN